VIRLILWGTHGNPGKMKSRFQIATGAGKFDQMLGGGVESCSITETWQEVTDGADGDRLKWLSLRLRMDSLTCDVAKLC